MARSFDQHKEHQQALSDLGRHLARRSGSKCELCDQAQRALQAYEVTPTPSEPCLEHCIFICEECRTGLEAKKIENHNSWRFLENSAWSEVPAVQVRAVRQLKRLANDDTCFWAREFLENLYIDPELEGWVNESPDECK